MDTPSEIAPSRSTNKILIELRDVVKAYDTPSGPFYALKGIHLQVNAGEFAAVIGKSGSGKSTLINMITGIDRPTMGEVIVGRTPIHEFSEDKMAAWRGKSLGVIFQFFQLLPTLTVLENVMLPMELSNLYPRAERKERALNLLEMVDLVDHSYKFPAEVSGGQAQRAAIARALANDPEVLVADEPTGSLDSKTGDAIFQLFEEFVSQGRTILMVTHDRSLASRVSRVIYIADGEITDQIVRQALPSLKPAEQVQLFSKLEPVTFPPDSVIIQQGDPADHFYILVKGEVVVVRWHPEGGEIVLNRLGSGQYFGEMGLLEGGIRTATVRAAPESQVVAMQLDRESFQEIVGKSTLSMDEIIRNIRQRVMRGELVTALPSLKDMDLELEEEDYSTLRFEPGAIIVREGEKAEQFYVILSGEVEVLGSYSREPGVVLARRGKGEFFGEMGLLRGGRRFNTVRAAVDGDGVELLALERGAFQKLVSESRLTKQEIARVMQNRMPANLRGSGEDVAEDIAA